MKPAEYPYPFAFERRLVDGAGEPPSAQDVTDFTRAITGFWKETEYFAWVARMSHGLDASHDPDMPDYALWWQNSNPEKIGDRVSGPARVDVAHHLKVVVVVSLLGNKSAFHCGQYYESGHL